MAVSTINVDASSHYKVIVGRGLIDQVGGLVRETASFDSAVIVSDSTVDRLYGEKVSASFERAGIRALRFCFPAGEASKNLSTLESLLEFLAENDVNKGSLLAALGGGVTGDLCGLAAAIYLRGLPYVQMPTTMLAAVDSSVGGKTAVNLRTGKNLAGAFHQPALVICDCNLFETLEPALISDGLAEVIKYGVIADGDFFRMLEEGCAPSAFPEIISRSVRIKADIVRQDEFDKGIRRLLNFGHTPGHALEALSGFTISHGRAVAMGMALMSGAADALGLSEYPLAERIKRALVNNGLPAGIMFDPGELAAAALSDKKRSGSDIDLVIPKAIGRAVVQKFPVDGLAEFFAAGFEVKS